MKKTDFFNFLISFSGMAFMLFLLVYRAKVFSVVDVGIFSYIVSVASIVTGFLNFGMPRVILRYYNSNIKTDFIRKVIYLQLILLFGLIISIFIVYTFFKIEYYVAIVFLLFGNIQLQNLDMLSIVGKKSAKSNLYQRIYFNLFDIIILIFIWVFQLKIDLYIILYTLGKYIIMMLLIYLLRFELFNDIELKITVFHIKEYIQYGMFTVLNTGVAVLTGAIDKVMLKNYISYKAVGLYTIAFTIGSSITMIGSVFSRTVYAYIAKYLDNNDMTGVKDVYKENVNYQIYLGVFFLIALVSFPKKILSLVGYEYQTAYLVLVVVSIGNVISLFTGMTSSIINLSKYFKFDIYFNIILLFMMVLLNIIFIPTWGILGAAVATALTLALNSIMKVLFVYVKFGFLPYKLSNLKYIFVGIFIFVVQYIIGVFFELNIISIILLFGIMFFVYDVILYYLKENNLLSIKLINKVKKWA